MAFLKIIFPEEQRGVLVNRKLCGKTNVVIEIQAGTHTISLVPPPDCKPAEIQIVLGPNDTGPLSPLEVTFEKI
jgi:hypothetical protein